MDSAIPIYEAIEELWKFNDLVCRDNKPRDEPEDFTEMHKIYDGEILHLIREQNGSVDLSDDDERKDRFAAFYHRPKKRMLIVGFPGAARTIRVDYESFEAALMQHSLQDSI